MTSESRRCCNVNVTSETQRRKHDVVTTLVFGLSFWSKERCRKHNVETMLWQRYPTSWPKYNQNLTLLQRRVPAGFSKYLSGKGSVGEDVSFIVGSKPIDCFAVFR